MARFFLLAQVLHAPTLHKTVIASPLIDRDGGPAPDIPSALGGSSNRKNEESKMKEFLKAATAPAAALVVAIALGTMIVPEASAAEFCRRDVTGHMTGCGYDSMDQCQAASSGLGGECFRDPYLGDSKNAGNTKNAGDSKNAYAYHPKSSRSRNGSPAAGKAGNTNQ
jgi:hypothetical protein